MNSIEPFGEKVRSFRRALGLTQLELAVRADVSERTVRHAEGGRPIKRDYLECIAGALGVDFREIARQPELFAGELAWRKNVDTTLRLVEATVANGDLACLKDLALPGLQINCRIDRQLVYAQLRPEYGREFRGYGGADRMIDLCQEFNARTLDRVNLMEPPRGGGDLVVLQGTYLVRYSSGNEDEMYCVFIAEFEDTRIRRIDLIDTLAERRELPARGI